MPLQNTDSGRAVGMSVISAVSHGWVLAHQGMRMYEWRLHPERGVRLEGADVRGTGDPGSGSEASGFPRNRALEMATMERRLSST